jgi:hypothetical protein
MVKTVRRDANINYYGHLIFKTVILAANINY